MFNWITDQISTYGYLGIIFLMVLENVFPPIPSELIMPMAGFVASRGDLNLPVVIAVGTFGSVLGAWFWYEVGRSLGKERLKRWTAKRGRWLAIHPDDIDRMEEWFHNHGKTAVFVGRFIPSIRTLISVPAGFVKMPRIPFLLWTAAGSVIWCGGLAIAGSLLGSQYEKVSALLDPLSTIVLVAFVGAYIYRVVTWKKV